MMNKTEAFRELHRLGSPMFVMPNAWCEGSARLIEQLGYPCLGTTSAGIAYARGYRDSSPAMDDEMRFENLSRIVQAVRIPVSADLENGLSKTPEGVADNFIRALETGCAGASLEDIADYSDPDSLVFFDLERASERVRSVCESTKALDPNFVVTARTDYLLGPHEYSLSKVIERLVAFDSAGANCLFAPGVKTISDLVTIQSELSKPLSVLPVPGMTLDKLANIKVQRVSLGSSLFRAAYKQIQNILAELDQKNGMDFMMSALTSENLDKVMR